MRFGAAQRQSHARSMSSSLIAKPVITSGPNVSTRRYCDHRGCQLQRPQSFRPKFNSRPSPHRYRRVRCGTASGPHLVKVVHRRPQTDRRRHRYIEPLAGRRPRVFAAETLPFTALAAASCSNGHGISPGHLQRRTPPRLCYPPCSGKQAGIGPISTRTRDDGLKRCALYRTSFRQGVASSRLFLWSPPHGRVRPSSSGQRSIFLNGALFFLRLFFIFWKVSTREAPRAIFRNPSRKRATP
jgi:hypothetical protein